MSDKIVFKTGEATVLAKQGQFTGAITEVLIGDVSGPAGNAFGNLLGRNIGYIYAEPGLSFTSFDHMMGRAEGYTRLFAIRACNQMVRPATVTVSKVVMRNKAFVDLYGGVVHPAVGDAVLDSVIEGVIPKEQANSLCCIFLVWLDPACAGEPRLDKKDLYRTNYEAAKLALQRAIHDEADLEQLIANRHKIRHEMFNPEG